MSLHLSLSRHPLLRHLDSDDRDRVWQSMRARAFRDGRSWLLLPLMPMLVWAGFRVGHALGFDIAGIVGGTIAAALAYLNGVVAIALTDPSIRQQIARAGRRPGVSTRTPPGSAPRAVATKRMLGVGVGAVLLTTLVGIAAFPDYAREYRLYLTEARPRVSIAWTKISRTRDEAGLRARFPQIEFRCRSLPAGAGIGERRCDADIEAFNGIPAMFVSAYFTANRLGHLAIAVPWWSHRRMRRSLERALGPTTHGEPRQGLGTPLAGWRLPGGEMLVFNRNASWNPLLWNQIFWSRSERCGDADCGRAPG
ncbi:MAG: hypothetical protein KDG52_00110 [Rhodocyclaceae bacterium]|nr:hypothetical protein [Rhodocyclaceae bacterium]